ncbi:TadE family type IV pilus minor pilin [Streptomyces sp. NPDC059708]|uniref:TadE family type IV pilus minor pilin n=1 Tax=Streptomyces sp. NPDC059708 TaxID=3346916 RepID=UPI003678BB41
MRPSDRKPSALADRGYVTAEAALVIPALVLFAALLVWALMAAARSEPAGAVLAAARQAAPPGAEVEVERSGDLWRVRVAAPAPGPAGLPVRIGARAVALAEDSVGPPP